MTIQDQVTKQLRKHLVQKQITCPVSGDVLDVRTARYIEDEEGTPYVAIAPRVATKIQALLDQGKYPFAKEGLQLNEVSK